MELLKDYPRKLSLQEIPMGYFLLQIAVVKPLTNEAVQVVFNIPDELREIFTFIPGQHIDLIVNINGEELHRSYSICSGPGEPLSIGVKALPDGKVSRFLNTELKSDDFLTVSPPRGSFILNKTVRKILLIGAGSGITPLLAMLRKAVDVSIPVKLIYGNRTKSSIMFYDEITRLESANVVHFLSGERREGFKHGRIDKENMLSLISADPSLLDSDAYYLCGPEGMITDIREALMSTGVSADKIHFELFSAPAVAQKTESRQAQPASVRCAVHVKLDGDKYQFETETEGPVLLEAARKAGLDAPFSCKTGICGSCRAKVLKGSAEMRANYALTNEELSEGYILTCQAHPTSDEISISYDD